MAFTQIDNTSRNAPSDALTRILDSVHALGLAQNLIELETVGYPTLKGVLDARKVAHTKAGILDRVERTTGKRIDPTPNRATRSSGTAIRGTARSRGKFPVSA